MAEPPLALLSLNSFEARIAMAIFERLFPADATDPGATTIGVVAYLDRALAGTYQHVAETYRIGLATCDRCARQQYGLTFSACSSEQQDALLAALEHGMLLDVVVPPQQAFFALLRAHLQEGLFADPAYGGNRDKLGWCVLNHPGIWFENTAEENLAPDPVTKGGVIQSLANVGYAIGSGPREPVTIPGYEYHFHSIIRLGSDSAYYCA